MIKGAQGLKVLYQMSLALGFNARPSLHQPVPETILLPLIPSQGPPLYYGTCPIARLQNPSNAAGRCSCSPFHR